MLARLASAGVIDYVISDEPDALMYGLDALIAWLVDDMFRITSTTDLYHCQACEHHLRIRHVFRAAI